MFGLTYDQLLAIIFGLLLGFSLGWFIAELLRHIVLGPHYIKPVPCPHGWENWDDCPDCSH